MDKGWQQLAAKRGSTSWKLENLETNFSAIFKRSVPGLRIVIRKLERPTMASGRGNFFLVQYFPINRTD